MPKALHDCVAKVEAKGNVDNAWAVCNAALKKSSKKRRRGKKRGRAYMAEATAPDPLLLAEGAPDRLRTLLESSMRTCMSAPTAKEPRCRAQALLAAYNAGWMKNDAGWQEGTPRQTTFAEQVDALGAPASFYMRNVKILEPGVWTNGATGEKIILGESDLRQIAADSNAIIERFKPPLLPDHPQMGRRGPAVGWSGRFYAKPDGLYAQEVHDIPPKFASLLESKQYRRLSAGLRKEYREDVTGKVYPMVVDHIAALGAAKPIIDTLPDLPEVLAASEMSGEVITLIPPAEGKETEMPDAATEAKVKAEQDEKAKKDQEEKTALQKRVAELEAQVKLAEATSAAEMEKNYAKLKEDLDRINRERAEEAKARNRREVESFVDGQVREGRIAPAHRETEVEVGVTLSESPDVISFGEGKTMSKYDAWRRSVEGRGRVIRFGEGAPASLAPKPGGSGLEDSLMQRAGTTAEEANKAIEALGKTLDLSGVEKALEGD